MDFIEHMTDAMRATLLDKEEIKNEFRFCMGKFLEAYEIGSFPLPAINEKGLPVLVGCKSIVVGGVGLYWREKVRASLNYLERFAPREEVWKLQNEFPGFNYACMRAQKDIK